MRLCGHWVKMWVTLNVDLVILLTPLVRHQELHTHLTYSPQLLMNDQKYHLHTPKLMLNSIVLKWAYAHAYLGSQDFQEALKLRKRIADGSRRSRPWHWPLSQCIHIDFL